VEKKLQEKLAALKRKAKEGGNTTSPSSVRSRSSLHKIIKTKKQADTFMKLLQSA
jgi:hypothetical protein